MGVEWIWARSDTPPKCTLDKWQKQARVREAEAFVHSFYRTRFLSPPPPNPKFNYVSDFSVCWHGSYLRFTATYTCHGPNATVPSFGHHFARLGYFGLRDCYNLWARRHNDQWIVIDRDLTLTECFDQMRENPWFHF